MGNIITYRNPLWDGLLRFLEEFKNYPPFERLEGGKHKNTLEQVYNRAVNKMRLSKTDFDTISLKFIYLSERDIPGDLVEYMDECEKLGKKCYTTKDGEEIIKEAETIVKKRRQENEIKEQLKEAQRKFDEAEQKRREVIDAQNKITDDFENAKLELDAIRAAVNSLNPENLEANDSKEEVKDE